MKERVAIVLGTTKDSAFAVANVIVGLERYSSSWVSAIFVYHDGLSEQDMTALKALSPKVRFELYEQEKFFERVSISSLFTEPLRYYTHMTFCRYEMFNLLNSFHSAVWIDFDVLVRKDISSIANYGPIAMLQASTPMSIALGTLPEGCPASLTCLSAGVIYVSDELEGFETITDELYDLTAQYCETTTLQDQAILNLLIWKRGIKANALPDLFGCPPEWIKSEQSFMVHTPGRERRFWNHQTIKSAFPEWDFNDRIWRDSGGTPFDGAVHNPHGLPAFGGAFYQYSENANLYDTINREICYRFGLHIVSSIKDTPIKLVSRRYRPEDFTVLVRRSGKLRLEITLRVNRERIDIAPGRDPLVINSRTFVRTVEGPIAEFKASVGFDAAAATLTDGLQFLFGCEAIT